MVLVCRGSFTLPTLEAAQRRFWPSESKLRLFETYRKQVRAEPFIVQPFFFFFCIIFWSYELNFSALMQLLYTRILPEGPDIEDLCPVFLPLFINDTF